MSKITKISKTYNIIIRLVILVVTYGFIYTKVIKGRDWTKDFSVIQSYFREAAFLWTIILVIFLMLVNWGIEVVKWRFLIGKIEKLSFFKAVQAVFTGSSISIVTPNRIGEYFGRAFILEKASHIQGILITILGSTSQLLITILTGTTGLILFTIGYLHKVSMFANYIYYSLLTLIVLLDGVLLFLYFNISFLATLREKLFKRRLKKFRKFFAVFSYFHYSELCYVITLSFFRYMIFSLQYFILLRVFSVPIPILQSFIITSVIFIVITVVPTVALTELGIRDSAAIYFFTVYFSGSGILDDNISVGVLLASTMLWVINLAIPAIIGTVFVFRLKFFRKADIAETTA